MKNPGNSHSPFLLPCDPVKLTWSLCQTEEHQTKQPEETHSTQCQGGNNIYLIYFSDSGDTVPWF